jgi:hypothetical protein
VWLEYLLSGAVSNNGLISVRQAALYVILKIIKQEISHRGWIIPGNSGKSTVRIRYSPHFEEKVESYKLKVAGNCFVGHNN